MFFWLSKIVWALLAPSTALILASCLGILIALRVAAWRTRALGVAAGAATLLALASFTSLSCLALAPLENRFPPARPASVSGIIVLGGAVSFRETAFGLRADFGEAADRLREAARLARAYPDVPIHVVGGNAFPKPGHPPESAALAVLLEEYGASRERLVLEVKSRTSAENARNLSSRGVQNGNWLLVTSAFHMPRAVGALRAAGVGNIYAAPTDWRCSCNDGPLSLDAVGNLGRLDTAAKEYLGLVAYAMSGRSASLFPAPASSPAT